MFNWEVFRDLRSSSKIEKMGSYRVAIAKNAHSLISVTH